MSIAVKIVIKFDTGGKLLISKKTIEIAIADSSYHSKFKLRKRDMDSLMGIFTEKYFT